MSVCMPYFYCKHTNRTLGRIFFISFLSFDFIYSTESSPSVRLLMFYVNNWFCCCISDKILGTLGEGTFGKVVKVRDVEL